MVDSAYIREFYVSYRPLLGIVCSMNQYTLDIQSHKDWEAISWTQNIRIKYQTSGDIRRVYPPGMYKTMCTPEN